MNMPSVKPSLFFERGFWICGRTSLVRGVGVTPVVAYNDWLEEQESIVEWNAAVRGTHNNNHWSWSKPYR